MEREPSRFRHVKRAFVTGGSGFVGSRLIPALRARGIDVVALARSDKSAAVVERLGATAARGDLDDRAALEAGMRGCDVVFHAAAHTDQFDPVDVHMRITTQGTRNVIEAAKMGAHVATLPPAVLRSLFNHPLTDKGLATFLSDWAKTGQTIV